MLIATHSGLRGRPGTELTDALIDETVGGFLALLSAGGLPERVAVASDERATSAGIGETVAEAALARGADVVDLGVVSTPGAKVAARGARTVVVPPGELHLAEALAGRRDALAGEGNGGVIVPETGPGRDGLEAGLVAMELMARTGAAAAAEPHDELVGVL